jgi:hypothetical protein
VDFFERSFPRSLYLYTSREEKLVKKDMLPHSASIEADYAGP